MSKTLQWMSGIAVVLVIAVGAFFWFFQWNWLRSPAERFGSAASGRGLTIGHVQGEWSFTPRFIFKDVHFGNTEWSQEKDMLSVETLAVVIDLRELLRGRMVLPEVSLDRPQLVLERRAEGQSNWTFGAELAKDVAVPEDRSEVPLIGRLTIKDGMLKYRDAPLGLDIDGRLQTVEAKGGAGNSRVELQGQGSLQGEPFRIDLTGGSLLSLRESAKPYPLTVEITATKSRARVSGTLADPIRFEGLNLDVALQGPNLEELSQITGIPFPITPRYDLKSKLQRAGDAWRFENIVGTIGRSDIGGTLMVDTGRERLFVEADLRSKVLDYRDVGSLIGIPPDQLDGDRTPNRVPVIERRVLPDAPLNIKQVREVDAKIRFRGDRVAAPDVPLTDVKLNLDLEDGVLKLAPLDVGVAGGRTVAYISINAREPRVRTDYDLRLRGYQLERFLQAAGLDNAGVGQIDGRVRLVGYGDSVRKSLATATGDVRLAMSGGSMSNLALELIGIDIAESLGFLASGDRNVRLRCGVVDIGIENGLGTPRLFVIDTTDTTVTAEGTVSLRDEMLNLRLIAKPKDPSILSARTPVPVTGRFAGPSVGVEPGPLIARAGAAVALGVLLTPLASILAFIEPGLEKDSDCAALLQQVTPSTNPTAPAATPRASTNGNPPRSQRN